jgi:citrate synthase
MFTPVFAVARTVGWVAHWIEMMGDPEAKLVRPRQLYQGKTPRSFVPADARVEHAAVVG